jgi:FkbH-like protein
MKDAGDLGQYLKSLGTVVTVGTITSFTQARVAQLTQKTNQFNTTTRRYTEDEIARMVQTKSHEIYTVQVADNFGDSGLTGLVILAPGEMEWQIDSFLLSCRVIGRGVENALLAHMIQRARQSGAKRLTGKFIATEKNAPAKDFYAKNGFVAENPEGKSQVWNYDLSKTYAVPDHVTMKISEV